MSGTKKLRITVGALLGAAAIVFIVLTAIGAVRINREYPQAQMHLAAMNEAVQIGDFEVRATDFHLYTAEEFLQAYPQVPPDMVHGSAQSGECRILVPKISVRNTGEQTRGFSADGASISTQTWSNGIDIRLISAMEEGVGMYTELAPGEEATMIFPCSLFQSHVSPREWAQVDTIAFRLTFTIYPEIYGIWLTPSI